VGSCLPHPSAGLTLCVDSLAAFLFTNVEPSIQRAIKHLEPTIKDRLDKEEEYGGPDWPGKPVS
jgi:hypothetical protein